MTENEAKIIIEGFLGDDEVINEALEMACKALEEVQELHKIATPEQARTAAIVAYAEYMFCPEDVKKFEMIEKALGFKLYVWQKTYLATGHYRRIGSTTAECLKRLLFNHTPIDFSERPRNPREECERFSMYQIHDKLQAAGVATNPILWSRKEKADYMRERCLHEKQLEHSLFEAERKRAENEQWRFIT